MIHAPFLHRDRERLAFADSFMPEVWLNDEADALGLIPFSAGPASCPGRELVLLTASAMLERLLAGGATVEGTTIDGSRPLPATLDHTRMKVVFGEQSALPA